MHKILSLILGAFASTLLSTVLKWLFGGAIGLVTYSIVEKLFWRYINHAIAELSGIGALSYLINLSRLDDAISVIIGAMAMRASIIAMTIKLVTTDGV